MRHIIHIDMDAFYASVEQHDFPELTGKAVIVGGSPQQRGVVSAASYEARRFGVHSAMPMSQAIKRCPRAVVRPVRMSRYMEISRQLHRLFQQVTPLIEPLSLDEAFLDVTGSHTLDQASDLTSDLWQLAQAIFLKWYQQSARPLRLLGFGVSNLSPVHSGQQRLFTEPQDRKQERVDQVFDAIRQKYGKQAMEHGRSRSDTAEA